MSKTLELLESLKSDRQIIEEKVKPLRDRRDEIVAKMQPLEEQSRELANQIKELQGDKAFELDKEISMLSRALGHRSLNNN